MVNALPGARRTSEHVEHDGKFQADRAHALQTLDRDVPDRHGDADQTADHSEQRIVLKQAQAAAEENREEQDRQEELARRHLHAGFEHHAFEALVDAAG